MSNGKEFTVTKTYYYKFMEEFNKVYEKRDKNLNSKLILHNCGLDNYLRYLKCS